MATLNITVTITPAELFEIARGQVEPDQREPLLAEINRRWPDGFRLPVHLVVAPESTN